MEEAGEGDQRVGSMDSNREGRSPGGRRKEWGKHTRKRREFQKKGQGQSDTETEAGGEARTSQS